MDVMDMEVFDFLEEEFDDLYDRLMEPRRIPEFIDQSNHMETLDATEFRNRFRLTKEAVNYIFSLIESDISTPTERNNAIKPLNRLLLTLRYYATGTFRTVIGDFTGVSKASASRIVNNVSQAIARLLCQIVKFPRDTKDIQQEFYDIAKFPRLVGAVDCTHVPIKSPGGDFAEEYRNRKSQYSFKVQTVVSAKLKILDIVARWPGAVHDQTIFDNSSIKQRFLRREFANCMMVGDKGYENTLYLLTPLQNPVSPAEHLYNESLVKSRNVVERTYRVWKNRFPVLSNKITLHVTRVQAVIVACAVLHNIAIDMQDAHFEDSVNGLDQNDVLTDNSENDQRNNFKNNTVLNNLINDYFASLLG